MIKAILSDFSRTLLFPKDENYTGKLNALHENLKDSPNYNIWEHYKLNQGLLEFYKQISSSVDVYIFTTKYIQEWPPLKEKLSSAVSGTFIASQLNVKKDDSESYKLVAEKVGYNVEEIIFIDDAQENINAARKAGMVTIKFNSNKQVVEDVRKALN